MASHCNHDHVTAPRQRPGDHLKAHAQLTHELARAQSYEEILRATQGYVRVALGLEQVWCYRFDERRVYIQPLAACGDIAESLLKGPLARQSVRDNPLLEALAAADTPIVIADASTDPRSPTIIVAQLRMHTIIILPLRLSEGYGVLVIGSFGDEGPRPPSDEELLLLEVVSGAVGATIDRVKLSLELRSLLGTLSDGVIYQDAEGRITYANPAAERILGQSADALRGRTFAEVCWRAVTEDGVTLDTASHPSMIALRTGQPVLNMILEIQTGPAHEPRWVVLSATPQPRAGEYGPAQIITTINDITASRNAETRRRESEERLRAFIEQASLGVAITDESGLLVEWNPALEELSGIPRAEILGQVFWDAQMLMTPKDYDLPALRQHIRQAMESALATGQGHFLGHPVEGKLLTRSGDIRTVLQSSFPIKGERGYSIGTIVRDITEQKRDELALRESEEKYRTLIESLETLIVTVDADGVYHYLSPLTATSLGGTPEQLTGRRMDEFFPPDITAQQLDHIRRVIVSRSGMVAEQRSIVMGRIRWYRASIQPLRDATGSVRLALVNLTDITELKAAELVLEEKVVARTAEIESIRRRLELATWSAGIGIWELNTTTGEFLYDEQMANLYGFAERPTGRSADWMARIHPEDQETFGESLLAAIRGERELDLEFRIILPNTVVRHLYTKALTLPTLGGEDVRLIGVTYDITVRKNAEQVLRQREEALRQANSELARANRTKDEFLANMSHELRTPLNGILALAEALKEHTYGGLSPRQELALQNIEQSGRHLLALINDILDVSKIEAGHLELSPDLFLLDDLCRSSLAFVKEQALKKGVALKYESLPQDLKLFADPRRLKQIVINLLSNAVKFTPTGGEIRLEVNAAPIERIIHIAVEDTGVGIEREDLGRLFTPFVQVDSSLTRQHEGTGLGLALVSRLTELHGGTVHVTSQPGKGSRFVVSLPWPLPADDVRLDDQEQTDAIEPPADSAADASRRGLLLIVDDSQLNIDSLSDYLRFHGYEVIAANDGQAGIDLAEKRRPDLILMDIQMPVLDGLEAIKRLRAMPGFAATPIIALTALAMAGDRERCLAAGATNYISKPVSLKGLLELVREHLA